MEVKYFKYDNNSDVLYIRFTDATCTLVIDLDTKRRIDYDIDGDIRGIELLCVRSGVNTDGLPYKEQIDELLSLITFG